ncbi:MAG: RDD family protein [Pseudomonadota bacterium]
MSSVNHDARYAPPQAQVEDIAPAGETDRMATRWQRLWAALVDVALAIAVLWLVSVVTPWNPWMDSGAGWLAPQLLPATAGFAIFLLLHGWLLAARGQTIGKALFKIRIARPDGTPASLGRLVGLRYGVGTLVNVIPAAGQVFAIADALLIFRAPRRCVHDYIADTVVLKA